MVFFKRKIKVLFVCTENLCRSPLAEGLLRHHLKLAGLDNKVKVSSAGTVAGRPGAKPDPRAVKVAALSGVNLGRIRASKISTEKLLSSDLVIALDSSHYEKLTKICPAEHQEKIGLLLDYLPQSLDSGDVPDPYYDSFDSFKRVFQLIDDAIVAFVEQLTARIKQI
ncbi:MAG: low molecular weight protein-tyrosine-phosphatase [Halioglobus sp.]